MTTMIQDERQARGRGYCANCGDPVYSDAGIFDAGTARPHRCEAEGRCWYCGAPTTRFARGDWSCCGSHDDPA